ncbi:hypothetical protein WJX72_009584 [[Myrmecia] bisecta]|uniref:Calcineurin-like phosphoesterase domain-containing protein n=1 Tax=[Myrmecia] bisecta TaxID=41462 RepID=A0AAW1P991_9CHLO
MAQLHNSEGSQFSTDTLGALSDFADRAVSEFAVAIMGDLHLQPDQMHLFHEAREQLVRALSSPASASDSATGASAEAPPAGARVVQLGDLGGYTCQPGSMACFETAKAFLEGFPVPRALVVGNHDLEGAEFDTDEENMAAWQQTFRQRHYWSADLGPVLCIGLSTTRFRSNEFSVHEVHIDDEQLRWFEQQLASSGGRPVVVFTHAPPMGCGLKVVQEVHVKNRCAWLNHSSNPEVFLKLVQKYPNIRLWFSGHFHLSHNYADSISTVGRCAFVQTGVIGECNRDGLRQSRFLRGDEAGYQLYTLDHDSGQLRLDLQYGWQDELPPQPILPDDERLCNPEDGWLCSQLDCGGGMLVEYDSKSMAMVGVVLMNVGAQDSVTLLDSKGRAIDVTDMSEDGADAVAVEHSNAAGELIRRVERNAKGGFFTIFQHNKWRLRKEQEQREAARLPAACA